MPEFIDFLSKLYAIVESSDAEAIYMLGDFNAHPGEPFASELFDFCDDNNLQCADIIKLGSQ